MHMELSMGSAEWSSGSASGSSVFHSGQTGCVKCEKQLDIYQKQLDTCEASRPAEQAESTNEVTSYGSAMPRNQFHFQIYFFFL